MSTDLTTVLTTAPDVETGSRIGRILLEERLVACVNVVPGITSLYRWEGEVQEDSEALIILKTRASLVPSLAARVEELHPYEVPEVLALPVVAGYDPYLEWVRNECLGKPED